LKTSEFGRGFENFVGSWQDAAQPKTALQRSHFGNLSILESSLINLGLEVNKLCSALSTGRKENCRLERMLWNERQHSHCIRQTLFDSSSALGEAAEGCASLSEQVP
jgi:hypothetical protein